MRNGWLWSVGVIGLALSGAAGAADAFEIDTLATSRGPLRITCIGHGTLMFEVAGKVIHVDPWSRLADYSRLPKADLVLITHDHADHFDPVALKAVTQPATRVLANGVVAARVPGAVAMANGRTVTYADITIEAVPAYNLVHRRPDGTPFHPKGVGNGYVLTLGDRRIYVAGDTENVPEIKALQAIHCAFLPMNLPYTMTPEMVAEVALALKPAILYPYHFGDTDTGRLTALLAGHGIEVRLRRLQ